MTDPSTLDAALDKIDALDSELHSAVQVAYRRGAHEWVRLNYPAEYERLLARTIAAASSPGSRKDGSAQENAKSGFAKSARIKPKQQEGGE